MKTKLLLLVTVFTTMTLFCSSATAQKLDIQGTWKLIESSGNPITTSFEQTKLITNNSFCWYRYDAEGKVYSGAGGSYILINNVYTETITQALPGMTQFLGKKATYEVKIEGNKMYIDGTLNDNIKVSEIWERVTNFTK